MSKTIKKPETLVQAAPVTETTPATIEAALPVQAPDVERFGRFVVKPVEVFAVDATSVTLPEERTKLIPLPERFFFEVDPAKVRSPKRRHQVDPSRPEGCAPVMPNLALLKKTGNPYPAVADATVVTGDQYKPFVAISHQTYETLKARDAYVGDATLVERIVTDAGLPVTADAVGCVRDTLRDLCLYGLADQFSVGRSRLYRLRLA